MAPIPMKPRRGLDCWLSVVIVLVTPSQSGSCAGKECLDCSKFTGAEAEPGRPGQAIHLLGPPRADNGTSHGGSSQHPADRPLPPPAPARGAHSPPHAPQAPVGR